jgi:ElaB/YqjD/DUF883 family membrane-anchored ribosome-binding protein
MAENITSRPTNASGETAQKFSQKAHEAVDRMTETAEQASIRLQDARSNVERRTRETTQKLSEYMQSHPFATLGIAFGAGILLAALLKR